jgi:cell wall assembly regulator SMI1
VSSTSAVAVSWARIHGAFEAKSSAHLICSLANPAAMAAVTKLEALFGVKLPVDFKQSLAIHDGQKPGAEVGEFPGFCPNDDTGSYYLMGCKAITRDWKMLRSVKECGDFDGRKANPDRGVKDVWWDLLWIPFAANGGGDYLCLDLAPAARGARGQVIGVVHDAPGRKIYAKSFAEWLQRRATSEQRRSGGRPREPRSV